jgi:hypothetical protein
MRNGDYRAFAFSDQPRHRRPTGAEKKAKPSGVAYEMDVILWSQEQARLLRAGRFAELDLEHLADEIEDVGKSEKRELVAVLLAHLLKWRSQPENRTNSWRATINDQRKRIALAIKETPSLKAVMRNRDWLEDMWLDARARARKETGLAEEDLLEACPGRWTSPSIPISGQNEGGAISHRRRPYRSSSAIGVSPIAFSAAIAAAWSRARKV